MHLRCARILAVLCCLASFTQPASAQQTGSISGKAVDTGGAILPGVTVEASSDVLPSARVTTTGAHGEFSLPALPPGNYTVTFTLSGMSAGRAASLRTIGAAPALTYPRLASLRLASSSSVSGARAPSGEGVG